MPKINLMDLYKEFAATGTVSPFAVASLLAYARQMQDAAKVMASVTLGDTTTMITD